MIKYRMAIASIIGHRPFERAPLKNIGAGGRFEASRFKS
jgi:hypothetical protein